MTPAVTILKKNDGLFHVTAHHEYLGCFEQWDDAVMEARWFLNERSPKVTAALDDFMFTTGLAQNGTLSEMRLDRKNQGWPVPPVSATVQP
jgi:hypothetical protein